MVDVYLFILFLTVVLLRVPFANQKIYSFKLYKFSGFGYIQVLGNYQPHFHFLKILIGG